MVLKSNYKQLALEHFPVLQDIDWDIANVLAGYWHLTKEELTLQITEDISLDKIKDCRRQLFNLLKSQYSELDLGGYTCKLQLRQRRGITVPSVYARDLAELFLHVSGVEPDLPICAKANNTIHLTEDTNTSVQGTTNDMSSSQISTKTATCHCDELQQAVAELVGRCGDYDKTILDLRCQMLELSNIVSDIKSKRTCDTHEICQDHDEPTSQGTNVSENSMQNLQCGQGKSTTYLPNDSSMVNESFMDISLTDMLRSSTPIDRDQACPTTSRHKQDSGSTMLSKIDTITSNQIEELRTHVEEELALVAADKVKMRESHEKMKTRVNKLEAFCMENSKFHAKNAKRITRVEKSQMASNTRHTPDVSCQNKYAVLADIPDEDAGVEDKPPAPSRMPRTRRDKTRVAIVGSSMVRGLGHMVSDTDIDACCYTNPGAKTDHIEGRIGQLTRPSDEVVVLQIGSNNMPDDTALTLIDKLDELIDDVTHLRPLAQVIMAPIPLRIDSLSYLNKDIKNVNQFIKNKCSKDRRLHFLYQSFTYNEYCKDGLHLNLHGKALYAQNVKSMVRNIMCHTR